MMIQSLCEVAIFLFQSNQKYVFQYTMKIDSRGKNDLHNSPIYNEGQTLSAKALTLSRQTDSIFQMPDAQCARSLILPDKWGVTI